MPALEDDGYSSEEDEEEEMEDLVLAAGAMMVLGAEEARISRAEKRKPSRRYLRRPQLLPTPRRDTPWQALYESRDDRAFITTMGIDVNTFHYILRSGFSYEWNHFPIPRPDTNAAGNPRLGRRSLSAEGALGLVYHYLTSAMPDVALQQIFALIPTTVSRYRKWALDILLRILRRIPEARIAWWSSGEECEEDNTLICARHPLLTGAIGSVDGLNILPGLAVLHMLTLGSRPAFLLSKPGLSAYIKLGCGATRPSLVARSRSELPSPFFLVVDCSARSAPCSAHHDEHQLEDPQRPTRGPPALPCAVSWHNPTQSQTIEDRLLQPDARVATHGRAFHIEHTRPDLQPIRPVGSIATDRGGASDAISRCHLNRRAGPWLGGCSSRLATLCAVILRVACGDRPRTFTIHVLVSL